MPQGPSLRERARRNQTSAARAVQRADKSVIRKPEPEPIERRQAFASELEQQTGTDVDPREDIDARADQFMPRNNFFLDVAVEKFQPQTQQDIGRQNVQRGEQGFQLTPGTQEREAVLDLQPETEQEIDRSDVRRTEQGFGLTQDARAMEAVKDLQDDTQTTIGQGDVTRRDGAFGLTREAQREEVAAGFDEFGPDAFGFQNGDIEFVGDR